MADNLTISIGADTSKARAEVALLEAELRKAQKEMKATANVAATTGDPKAIQGVKTLSVAVDGMTKKLVVMKKEISGANKELNNFHQANHAHKFYLVENSVQSLNGAFMALGHNIGGAKAAIAGFVVGMGIQRVIEQVVDLDKKLRDIRDLGRDIGQKPLVTQAVQELAKQAGESAETANKFLQGLGATLSRVATQTKDIGGSTANEQEIDRRIAAARGMVRGVQVSRGGVPMERDFSDPLAILGVNAERLKRLSPEKQMKELGDAFLRAEKNARALQLTETQLNEIAKSVFGVPTDAAKTMIAAQSELQKKTEELRKSQRGATAENLENIRKVDSAFGRLGEAWDELWGRISAESHKNLIKLADDLANLLTRPGETLKKSFSELFDNISKVATRGPFGRIFQELSKLLGIGSAQAATGAQAATPATTLPDVNVAASGAGMPVVYRGPGRGEDSGHGPPSGDRGTAGHGPGSRPTQSITPGVSDYQAPPAQRVEVMAAFTDAQVAATKASETAADKAYALASSLDAASKAADAWVRSASPTGFASGGMISGPGTGTSDSIMARLSSGEFVMRAAAVSHWGPAAMAALNGLRNPFGGRSLPRFAEGGLVGAAAGASGTPVHLHLDSGTFVTHASPAVASALVVEARRQQMRSAGVKPSWYGGRAGA